MAIKIAAWNTEGRLTAYKQKATRGTPEQILAGIRQLDADIFVLPEAYVNEPAAGVDDELKAMGYKWYDTKYHDTMHDEDIAKWGDGHLRVLFRIPIVSAEMRRWGRLRDLAVLIVKDPESGKEICVIATHLDDISEQRRQQQLDDIIPFIQKSPYPLVMTGDFNAMWHEGRARLIGSRCMRTLVGMLPRTRLQRIMVKGSAMADGSVLARLKKAGLHDADPTHRPTATMKKRDMSYFPSIPLIQIDHILYSKGVEVSSFDVKKDGGSDHRAISAIIKLV